MSETPNAEEPSTDAPKLTTDGMPTPSEIRDGGMLVVAWFLGGLAFLAFLVALQMMGN